MINNILSKIPEKFQPFFKKKRHWFSAILVIVIIILTINNSKAPAPVIESVVSKDLFQTVLATGQVTSHTDLALSFTSAGVIKNMYVDIGTVVRRGQILSTLEQGAELASLLSAKAKYNKLIEGATNEEINVAKTALNNAEVDLVHTKRQQDVLVQNAYQKLLNTDLTPIISSGTTSGSLPTISGTYTGNKEGIYEISAYSSGSGGYFQTTNLENVTGNISTNTTIPLGTKGLFIKFPTGYATSGNDHWSVLLPNKQSANYITNYNAYTSALETSDSAIATAQATLDAKKADYDLKVAKARTADIDLVEADVLSAQANLEKTIIRAPADGTITTVDKKLGEQIQQSSKVFTLQDISNLYIDTNINESNIALIQVGQKVNITYDAIGKDKLFAGTVSSIDPSATTSDGVVNYRIKIAFADADKLIRPGMNANVEIITQDKPNVIVIPQSAIIQKTEGSFVDVQKNKNKPTSTAFEERKVETGIVGDGNLVEIIKGLSAGEVVIIPVKK